ncbi:hypothetical protein TNCV_3234581 [Trichonephila clavipes]|nr:hypothetical protein TNCV_3234581 [Trichonephila clavipes]
MTINKSQGQTMTICGLDLENPCFSQGQLHVHVREMALVKKQPRAGTVTALEDTKLAFLEVKAFERLLGPCMDIMKSRMEKYQKA